MKGRGQPSQRRRRTAKVGRGCGCQGHQTSDIRRADRAGATEKVGDGPLRELVGGRGTGLNCDRRFHGRRNVGLKPVEGGVDRGFYLRGRERVVGRCRGRSERRVPEHIDAGNELRGRHVARCVFEIKVAPKGSRTGDVGRRGDIEAREGVDRVDERGSVAPGDIAAPEIEVGSRGREPVPSHEAAGQLVDRRCVERRVAERKSAGRAVADQMDRRHAWIGGQRGRHVGEQVGRG